MLKIVPVCGGGSDFIVEGSTCGRAGRRLRRRTVFVFLGWVVMKAVLVSGLWRNGVEDGEGVEGMMGGIEASTSVMLPMGEIVL